MDYVEYLARKKSVKRGSYVVTPCNGNGVVVPEAVAEREPQTLVPSPIIDYSLAQEEVAKIIQFKTKKGIFLTMLTPSYYVKLDYSRGGLQVGGWECYSRVLYGEKEITEIGEKEIGGGRTVSELIQQAEDILESGVQDPYEVFFQGA